MTPFYRLKSLVCLTCLIGVPMTFGSEADTLMENARRGDAEAEYALGEAFAKGAAGIPKNTVEAAAWFRKAADQGYEDAEFGLGVMYALGGGVPKDSAEAVGWFRKAAAKGHRDAAQMLGTYYALGEGVRKDGIEAYAWLDLAARLGSDQAKELRSDVEKTLPPEQLAKAKLLSLERRERLKIKD